MASTKDNFSQSVQNPTIEHESRESLRNALDDLQKSEAKLRTVIDTIPAVAWYGLPDGSKQFLNKRWRDYTGVSPEESYGWGWQAVVHPEDLRPLMAKWSELRTSEEAGEIEARVRRYDGVYRWSRWQRAAAESQGRQVRQRNWASHRERSTRKSNA